MKSVCNYRPARSGDESAILGFIRELAEFEKLSHEVVATETQLHQNLFGAKPTAEVVIAEISGVPVGFALFFTNFSTFLGRPGLYLEDLYVQPARRGVGIGLGLLKHLAQLAEKRGYGRFEWSVLNWNQKAIDLYQGIGAKPMDEWTVYRMTGDILKKFGSSV